LLAQVSAFGLAEQGAGAAGELLIAFAKGVHTMYESNPGPSDF
jgi:hypothetical protein